MNQPKKLFLTGQSTVIGNKPQTDPEGQTVTRNFNLRAQAQAQNSGAVGPQGTPFGSIPAQVQYHGQAGEMANAARTACMACKHWDKKAWQQLLVKWTGPGSTAEQRETIRTMEGRIMMAGYGYAGDNTHDEDGVQKTLWNHGICRVLSDWVKAQAGEDPMWWPVVPWGEASCPTYCRAGAGKPELQVVTAQQPYGLFVPKDPDAKKAGAQRYDQILKTVQGK